MGGAIWQISKIVPALKLSAHLPADHAEKPLISVDFYRPKCVDRRYLFRWRSASFFRRMASSGYGLHFIIHISCLVFFEQKKYNKPYWREIIWTT